jgi:hypothetical protein
MPGQPPGKEIRKMTNATQLLEIYSELSAKMAVIIPQINEARKVGEPSVSIKPSAKS